MAYENRRYDMHFTPKELKRIKHLRMLYENSQFFGWALGIVTTIAVFLIQIPFDRHSIFHDLCTYGCVPFGIGLGVWLKFFLVRFADDELLERWDPLYLERSGENNDTKLDEEVSREMLRLTDDMHFMSLPIQEQRQIVNKMYRDRGLPEPNKKTSLG